MTHRSIIARIRILPLALATSLAPLSLAVQAQSETSMDVDPVVVSATRGETSVSETARSVTVVDREEVDKQAKVSKNLSDVLANTVPGFGPSTESISGFGQTMRGRNYLVLIDGVPQTTLLRNTYRGLNSIAASAVERIEVIRGGTSAYGFGGNGGVINIITREASDETVSGFSQAGASVSTEDGSDSIDYETEHRVSGTSDDWDYLLSGSFVERGGRFDSEGDRIPPNGLGGQGGFSDTTEYNVLGKLGYSFDSDNQRIELMFNEFNNNQDSDYTFGEPEGAGKTPAIRNENADPGARQLTDPEQINRTARLNYEAEEILGSSVSSSLYYGEYSHVFPRYYNPASGAGFPQTDVEGDRWGMRTTINTPVDIGISGASVNWGVDFIHDSADEFTWTPGPVRSAVGPDGEQEAFAVFGELEVPVSDFGLARVGLRNESIQVDVNGAESNNLGNKVNPGSLDYNENLVNLGYVQYLTDRSEVFVNFSQGFAVSNILRQISDSGPVAGGGEVDAGSFESEAEKVDNYEVGFRYTATDLSLSGTTFYSESNGAVSYDQDIRLQRNPDEVWGVEFSADYALSDYLEFGGDASWQEGIEETDQGSQRLSASRISPLKINSYVEESSLGWLSNRFQLRFVGERDRAPEGGAYSSPVSSYALVDYLAEAEMGPGTLSVSIKNLLNRDYSPMLSQASSGTFEPYSRYKGEGRRIGVGYSVEW